MNQHYHKYCTLNLTTYNNVSSGFTLAYRLVDMNCEFLSEINKVFIYLSIYQKLLTKEISGKIHVQQYEKVHFLTKCCFSLRVSSSLRVFLQLHPRKETSSDHRRLKMV